MWSLIFLRSFNCKFNTKKYMTMEARFSTALIQCVEYEKIHTKTPLNLIHVSSFMLYSILNKRV